MPTHRIYISRAPQAQSSHVTASKVALPQAEAPPRRPSLKGAAVSRASPHAPNAACHGAAGTMRGFVSAQMSSGVIYHELKLMIGPSGKFWKLILDALRAQHPDAFGDEPERRGDRPRSR
jgi:hypothetical protein